MTKHLWEIDHPYYGPEGNYFANAEKTADYRHAMESWKAFQEEFSWMDDDLNWLFRWDWIPADEPGNPMYEIDHDELRLFYLMPRKGTFLWVTIQVEREDELEIRQWLFEKWGYMRTMWAGVSDL